MQNKPLHIIADANIWGATHAFACLEGFDVQLEVLEHQHINAASLQHADVLLVRSSTKVNAALLDGSSIRFVGTATIGDDHIDKAYLAKQHICFASAAGSSTDSVVEYMLAALSQLQQSQHISFDNDSLGIIGVGRIGSLLEHACNKLGISTMLNDPPRQRKEKDVPFQSLDHLLHHTDILTLHTPLITAGEDKTLNLLNADKIKQFKGKGIINAGRGACLDNAALLAWLHQDKNRFAVLDCWQHEPQINLALLQHPQTLVATPHIAGHSLDGKAANTFFVYRDLCDFLNIAQTWDIQAALPPTPPILIKKGCSKVDLATQFYPIHQDTAAMKQAASADHFSTWFQSYRRHYPVRRAWEKILSHDENRAEDTFF